MSPNLSNDEYILSETQHIAKIRKRKNVFSFSPKNLLQFRTGDHCPYLTKISKYNRKIVNNKGLSLLSLVWLI